MANLRLVDHYIPGTAGGCCHFCRTSQRDVDGAREAVVATSVELSEGGEIALCEACVREMAHLLGLVDAGAVAEAKDAAHAARRAQYDAEAERDTAVAVAEALRRWDAKAADAAPAGEPAQADAAAPRKRSPKATA